jgi:hypothetical protein
LRIYPGHFVSNPAITKGLESVSAASMDTWVALRQDPHYREIVSPDVIEAPTVVQFMNQGVGEPFWPQNLIPAKVMLQIVEVLYRTGQLPDGVKWGPRYRDDDYDDSRPEFRVDE